MALGQTVVEKVVTALVQPCGLLWLLLIGCMSMAVNSRRRELIVVAACPLLLLTIAGNDVFAEWLVRTREGRFADIQPLSEQRLDVVVVLGGGASTGMNYRSQGNGSGDRLILAAELYHQGLTRKFICTGRKIGEMTNIDADPSQRSAEILMALGVPEAAIERFGGRNTSEEMTELGKRFNGTDQRVGLLTSAWHLPRALALAKRNGFEPDPLPADFLSKPSDIPRTTAEIVHSLIPQSGPLDTTSMIVKEYVGTLVGR
ncbi:MAG: YdcF family protein [Planctomycetaceae bacterium]